MMLGFGDLMFDERHSVVEQGLSGIVRVAGQAHQAFDAGLPVEFGRLDDVLIHLRQQYIQAMADVTRQ
ncbi:hypothetical protein D3C76_1587510 [compost metagenome]